MAFLPVTGAILAGGLGRRLGKDKATLLFQGRPLALHVAGALRPWVQELWLLTNQPLLHAGLGLPLVLDLLPFQGPLGGLVTALFFSPTPWVLAVAVDSPLLQPPVLAALIRRAATSGRPAVVCESARGLEALPGLFHGRLRPRLEEYLAAGERRLRPFVMACRPEVLSREETRKLDPKGQSFLNVNTPAELAAAGRRFQGPEGWVSGGAGTLDDAEAVQGGGSVGERSLGVVGKSLPEPSDPLDNPGAAG